MPNVAVNLLDLVTFSRTTSATYINSAGLLTVTPIGVNLLAWTEQFDNAAAWSGYVLGSGIAPTVTANAGTAPDGSSTADRIQFSLAGGTAVGDLTRRRQSYNTPATTHTFSVYLRSTDGTSTYDMQIVSASGVGVNIVVTGSWQRFTATDTGFGGIISYAVGLRGGQTPANSNTADVLAWGAQLEQAATASTYTKNEAGLYPPRFDYDPVTLQPKGLLIEEQRVNLATYSEFPNGVTDAPNRSGPVTATTFTGLIGTTGLAFGYDGVTGGHAYKSYVMATTTYTLSVYVRMDDGNAPTFGHASISSPLNDFLISINATAVNPTTYTTTAMGGGLYRVSATSAVTAGGANIFGVGRYVTNSTRTFKVSGYQLEAGAFATSYIPTVASQVTRTGDVASINAPNFASWYNQSEGTFYFEGSTFKPTTLAVVANAFEANDGTSTNRLNIRYSTGNLQAINTNTPISSVAYTAGVTDKAAFGVKANDFSLVRNGVVVGSNTSIAMPVGIDRLLLGGGAVLNGYIRSITYYPTRLTNAQLQALTA